MKKHRNRLFRSVQRTILYLALMMTVLACALFYVVSRQVLLERTCQADVKSLRQVYSASDGMKRTAGTIGWQVYNDQLVAYLLYADYFDSNQLCASLAQLNNYRFSNPYIDSIYIYNGNLNSITASSSQFGTYDAPLSGKDAFFDSQIADIIRGEGSAGQYQPIPRLIRYQNTKKFYYTYLTCDTFNMQNIRSAVFVNYSGEWLDSIVQNKSELPGSTLILNQEGVVVSGGGYFPMLTDASDMEFYRRMQECTGEGYFVTYIDGEKTLASYLRPGGEDWQYLRLTPYPLITGDIDQAISSFLLIGFATIAVGGLISFLFSLRVRKPIGEIYQNLEQLEQESRKNRSGHRQQLFRNLLYGSENPEAVLKSGTLNGLRLKGLDEECLLVLVRIRNYRGLYLGYDSDDRSLFRYAVANVAAEICSRSVCAEVVDMGGGSHLTLILTHCENVDLPFQEWVNSCLQEITSSVSQALSLELSYTVSELFPFQNIAAAYRITQEAAGHQLFCKTGDILWAKQVLERNSRHYTYPQEREEQMVEAILSSNEEQADAIMRGVILETEEYSFSVVNLVVSRIALSLLGVVDDLKSSHLLESPESDLVESYAVTHLAEEESIEAVVGGFEKMIHEIVSLLENKRNAHHFVLVQKISDIIQKTFQDPECCLDSVAEAVGLSPAYAGKLYRRYTLKSVAETIGELRMEQAKRLLLENRKLTISVISARTGFSSNSYFSKVFRKENGMTPNEYRNLNQSGGNS